MPAGLLVSAQVADLWTTHAAITSGRGREANPWMQGSNATRIVWKAAGTGAVVWIAQRLERRGSTTAARVLLYGGAGMMGIVAVRNARAGR